MATTATLNAWDIFSIAAYFAIVMVVGIMASIKANRGSARGFFLAGKSMTWIPIASSIFATNMGATMFVGLAGSAANTGFAPVMFEWHATYMLVLLGWVFVPIYIASGTYTMPEYLKKRYGGKRLRIYFACVQLFQAIITGISAQMYAGALFVYEILGWNLYGSTVFLLLITAVYTIGGGLTAVMYTDTLQSVILVGGSFVLAVMAMDKVGGYEAMTNLYLETSSNNTFLTEAQYSNLSCAMPPKDDAFHIFQGLDSAYPWPGLVFGLTILALSYFCTSQVIVQRNLSAKNMMHSKAACVLASYLKILPFFLFVWPGMISRILYPDEIACSDEDQCNEICQNPAGCTNLAYPILVLRILPSGLRGLMLAALLAALMSSLTSEYNSSASIFTLDIWKHFRPQAKEKEVVIVGRIFSLVLVVLSVAWLPVLQAIQGSALWDYMQGISSYISPPWVMVILTGMFWKRCTEQGAWWGLMAGLVVGVSRMGVHFTYGDPVCFSPEEDNRPGVYTDVHYLHFAIILALITLVVIICVSMVTKPRKQSQLHRVTWWTRHDETEPDLTDQSDMPDQEDDYIPPEQLSRTQRAYNWVCGFNQTPKPKLTQEELLEQRRKLTDIGENPFWSTMCNYNAVIAVAITCFIIGFYA